MKTTQDIIDNIYNQNYSPFEEYKEEILEILNHPETKIIGVFTNVMYVNYTIKTPTLDERFFDVITDHYPGNPKIEAHTYFTLDSYHNVLPQIHFTKHLIQNNNIIDNPEFIDDPRFTEVLKEYAGYLKTSSTFYKNYLLL